MDKKGTHSVKNLTEKVTMISVLTSGQVSKKTSEQVNELIVLLTFFCRSYKSAFSHHDNVRASST